MVPEVSIEIERLTTHSREWIMPFLWATDGDIGDLKAALGQDPSVDDFRVISAKSDIGYFNVHWSEEIQDLVDQIIDQHGIVQEAEATDGTWYLKLQFVDRDALEEFQAYFRQQDYAFELQRLHDSTPPKEREYDLTPEQREALVTALELGYFEIPRDAQIEELAQALDISTNAVSQRLRRATGNLTRNTLTISPPEAVSDTD